MTVCKHCFIDSATLVAQARRIDELEEKIAQLTHTDTKQPPIEGFTPNESAVVRLLLMRERVSKGALFDVMSHPRGGAYIDTAKFVDVYICKVRKKLGTLGLSIKTIHGFGYCIPRERASEIAQEIAA